MEVTKPCTLDDIRYVERQYHSYPVNPDGSPMDLADENPAIEPDYTPYACGSHGLDFHDWDEVKAHLKAQQATGNGK